MIINLDRVIKTFESRKEKDLQDYVQAIIRKTHEELGDDSEKAEALIRITTAMLNGFYDAGAKAFCRILLDDLKSQQGESDLYAS